MQLNILWSGIANDSLENCLVDISDNGVIVSSTIVGVYEGAIYSVEYRIRTNEHWETRTCDIFSRHHGEVHQYLLETNGKGSWLVNGLEDVQFTGCLDIDIPLTPFTNSLPINRLQLPLNQKAEIRVIYIDLLEFTNKAVSQKYIRLSETEYHYENIPNDFEANICTDEYGLVIDYPSLFKRTAVIPSHYRF